VLPSLTHELDDLKTRGLYRQSRLVTGPQDPLLTVDGREVVCFCSNNYLGLATHPRVKERAAAAITDYGVSPVSSRLVSGHMTAHQELEGRMAAFLGAEAALSFPSGYMANLGAVGCLVGKGDVVFSDRLNHRSLIDACRLSRADIVVYDHGKVDQLTALIDAHPDARRRLIVTDAIFSMDGDLAPLPELVELAELRQAILMVDDAHGTGALGPSGAGTHEHFGITIGNGIDILMTSGSKGLGTYGGYIAGSADLIDLLRNRAPSFIYTTALPADICEATQAALDVLQDEPERRLRLSDNAAVIRAALTDLDFDVMASETHIIPVRIGDAKETMTLSEALFDRGIFLQGIRPPTVPEGESRLRLSVMATHTDEHIAKLINAMGEVKSKK
jgi:8-amino-7-oxononanoate synthase